MERWLKKIYHQTRQSKEIILRLFGFKNLSSIGYLWLSDNKTEIYLSIFLLKIIKIDKIHVKF